MAVWRLGAVLTAAAGAWGCTRPEVQACHAEMQVSQQALVDMDKRDPKSVSHALGLIERTQAACERAGRADEATSIASAKREVSAHLDALEKRANQPQRPQLTPAELEALLEKGDPDCPRGQGYEHGETKKLIRCTGPQLVDLRAAKAREYFERRGYTLRPEGPAPSFKAEFGATAYVFRYAAGGVGAPECLAITGRPGTPWQEIVARAAGVHPDRVKRDEPVRVGARELGLRVEGGPEQWSVALGACPSGAASPGP